jgi:hypothetical protein
MLGWLIWRVKDSKSGQDDRICISKPRDLPRRIPRRLCGSIFVNYQKKVHPRDTARQKEWTDVYVESLGMETLAAESQQGNSERRNQFWSILRRSTLLPVGSLTWTPACTIPRPLRSAKWIRILYLWGSNKENKNGVASDTRKTFLDSCRMIGGIGGVGGKVSPE